MKPRISIIICTLRRAELLERVLASLRAQTCSDFEILIVDAGGSMAALAESQPRMCVIQSKPGLARQRNIGLRSAVADWICFLDDDVCFGPTFIADALSILQQPGMENVGGLTAYDTVNYGQQTTVRWKLRYWLGAVPSLNPGDADHLGRNVPLSFLQPFSGTKQVRWLAGFCMIYRRIAIDGLFFEEKLGTYAGEDRDYSMNVGRNWKLVASGDLKLEHHPDKEGRLSDAAWVRRVAFGLGHSFRKRWENWADSITILHFMLCELLVDLVAVLRRPSLTAIHIAFARQSGLIDGLKAS